MLGPKKGFQNDADLITLSTNQIMFQKVSSNQQEELKHRYENRPK